MSFIFNPEEGETLKSIRRKRQLAESMRRASTRMPQNVGQGLAAIGNALAGEIIDHRADKAEETGRSGAGKIFDSLSNLYYGSGGDSGSGGSATPSISGTVPEGTENSYRDAIASIESAGSGDYAALGPVLDSGSYKGDRAYGRYQIMGGNIPSWSKEALGREVSVEEFMADPNIQDQIFDFKFGQSVKKYGNPQDAASVWFTGRPASQGANASDQLGTTGSEYVSKFNAALGRTTAPAAEELTRVASLNPTASLPDTAPTQATPGPVTPTRSGDPQSALASSLANARRGSGQAAPQAPAPIQVAQAGGNLPANYDSQLLNALGNEFLSPGQQRILESIYRQRQQERDPVRQMQLEKGRLELESLRNPERKLFTDKNGRQRFLDTQELAVPDLVVEPEFQILSPQEVEDLGLPPGAYQKSRDNKISQIGKAGVEVNLPAAVPEYSKLPAGFVYLRDEKGGVRHDDNGLPMVAPIPGGPADIEAQKVEKAAEAKQAATERSGNVVLDDIDRSLKMIRENPLPTTGVIGGLLSYVPGTGSYDAGELIKTVRANTGFDRLQAMRDSSPTGGALGQVSNQEMGLLQAALGNLDQFQSKEQLVYNLQRVRNIYLDIVHGPGNGPPRVDLEKLSKGEDGQDQEQSGDANTAATQSEFLKGLPSMTMEDLQRADRSNLTIQELQAASKRYRELMEKAQ